MSGWERNGWNKVRFTLSASGYMGPTIGQGTYLRRDHQHGIEVHLGIEAAVWTLHDGQGIHWLGTLVFSLHF